MMPGNRGLHMQSRSRITATARTRPVIIEIAARRLLDRAAARAAYSQSSSRATDQRPARSSLATG